jgi:hypothetical protein
MKGIPVVASIAHDAQMRHTSISWREIDSGVFRLTAMSATAASERYDEIVPPPGGLHNNSGDVFAVAVCGTTHFKRVPPT